MAADAQKNCPICSEPAALTPIAGQDAESVACRRCGKYVVAGSLGRLVLGNKDSEHEIKQLLPYLSAHTRQASERGEQVMLDTRNWKSLAQAHMGTPFAQKVNKTLELFSRISKPGHECRIIANIDFPLVDAEGPGELQVITKYLADLGYLDDKGGGKFYVTGKGWERLESGVVGRGILGKCFVAMSFDPSLKDAYEQGIYLAVKQDCTMDPVRIDLVEHNEKICDKILAEIRSCQFLVADFTLQRAGVYFEAGFAMGLGRPVIWTCREDDFVNTHFDTRQYNHIVWDTPEDLREKLTNRIKATIVT